MPPETSSPREKLSVFTIYDHAEKREGYHPDRNDPSAVIATVRFNDNGTYVDEKELTAALQCITTARTDNPNGALVMVFVHGWHHGWQWRDPHFHGFRNSLLALARREAERNPQDRRVIGIYLGWNGEDPDSFWYQISEHLTFWNRYDVAEQIGSGEAFSAAIRNLIKAVKGPTDPDKPVAPLQESSLIMMGHSMGALMFETAFLSLLSNGKSGLVEHYPAPASSVTQVESNGQAVAFPDRILLLNSATDSRTTKAIIRHIKDRRLTKKVVHAEYNYEAPLLISMTSESDWATRYGFRIVKFWRKTDGHDDSLLSHDFTRAVKGAICKAKALQPVMKDFGQCWHCLRPPTISNNLLIGLTVDLPLKSNPRSPCHVRYRLEPQSRSSHGPFWVFQVPSDIIDGHNAIYDNAQSNLLIMAMLQASGCLMSLAIQWAEVFEADDEGPCDLPESERDA